MAGRRTLTLHDQPFSVAGQRTIDMDLSDVAAGAYYLLATRNGEQQVIKIMVQR